MTAEIAVMNKHAVALAADSAVTIGVRQKIYNSANKLFMLSKYEPVGAMIYGGAEFMGVPWETILKCYRLDLGEHSFATLDEYACHLVEYLHSNDVLFPEARKLNYLERVLASYYLEVVRGLNMSVETRLSQDNTRGGLTELEIVDILTEQIAEYERAIELRSVLPHFANFEQAAVIDEIARKQISIVFERFPIPKELEDALARLAYARITRDSWLPNMSGLVIAGFGKREVYPSIRDLKVELSIGSALRFKVDGKHDIDDDNDACIMPFAQGEMVQTFMEGADPTYRKFAEGQLDTLFQAIPEKLVESLVEGSRILETERTELRQALGTDMAHLLEHFKRDLQDFQKRAFVHPTMDIVGALPKGELAEMAETLVSLTSFKRRMSMDVETVGGPVDVAVISKGDGFIWVKRKHYFERDLNHGFFSKYYRS